MTDFEKIIKVTRMAKKDAQWVTKQSVIGFLAISVVDIIFSQMIIKSMFSGYELKVAMDWYDTVYSMRLRKNAN